MEWVDWLLSQYFPSSFFVNVPNTIKAKTMPIDKIRNPFPNAVASKPITLNIKLSWTKSHTR